MAAEFRDYYQTLGVSKNASDKEIKAAYRRLAREWHPDVNPGNTEAEEKFKEISEAHEVLSDPEKRARYDQFARYGRDWRRAAEGAQGPGWPGSAATGSTGARGGSGSAGYEYRTVSPEDLRDLFGTEAPYSDFFESLFGFGGGAARVGSWPHSTDGAGDVGGELEVTLEESFRGGTRALELRDRDGSTRRVEVRIPPGVQDGTRLRLAGQGTPASRAATEGGGAVGAAGDLYLRVRVLPHHQLERRGDDLHTTARVPLTTMVLGGEVAVPSLDGRPLTVTVPPETPHGRTLRLRGQGMPRLRRPAERGDLYVHCEVVLPTRLTDEERRLFRRLAELREGARAA